MNEDWASFGPQAAPLNMHAALQPPEEDLVSKAERELCEKYRIFNAREFFRIYNEHAKNREALEVVTNHLLLPPGFMDQKLIVDQTRQCFTVINEFTRRAPQIHRDIVAVSGVLEKNGGTEADRLRLGQLTDEYVHLSRRRWKAHEDLLNISSCKGLDARTFHKDVLHYQRMWVAGQFKRNGHHDLSVATL